MNLTIYPLDNRISEKKQLFQVTFQHRTLYNFSEYRLRIKEKKKKKFESEGTTNKLYSSVNSFIFNSNTGTVILKIYYI